MEREQITECGYCGAIINRNENPSTEADRDFVPPIHEEDWWAREAELHCDGCEWVTTRAHRILAVDED